MPLLGTPFPSLPEDLGHHVAAAQCPSPALVTRDSGQIQICQFQVMDDQTRPNLHVKFPSGRNKQPRFDREELSSGAFHKAADASSVLSVCPLESLGGHGHLPPGLPRSESRRGVGREGVAPVRTPTCSRLFWAADLPVGPCPSLAPDLQRDLGCVPLPPALRFSICKMGSLITSSSGPQ